MYAVLMKQMLYLKMLAWLEDNIYCNPAIDDLALYMGYSRRFVYGVFYQYGQLPIGQYIRLRRLTIAAVSLRLTRPLLPGSEAMTRRRPFPGSLRSAFRSRHVNTVARRTGTRQSC